MAQGRTAQVAAALELLPVSITLMTTAMAKTHIWPDICTFGCTRHAVAWGCRCAPIYVHGASWLASLYTG